jgi:hypothetical protein
MASSTTLGGENGETVSVNTLITYKRGSPSELGQRVHMQAITARRRNPSTLPLTYTLMVRNQENLAIWRAWA